MFDIIKNNLNKLHSFSTILYTFHVNIRIFLDLYYYILFIFISIWYLKKTT